MNTNQSAPKNVDEYIAGFPPDVQEIQDDDQKSSTRRGRDDQVSNANLHVARKFGLFCRFQKAYGVLSWIKGRKEKIQSVVNL